MILPNELYNYSKFLFEKEKDILEYLYENVSHDYFFLKYILIPPIKFRPPGEVDNRIFPNAIDTKINKIIKLNENLETNVTEKVQRYKAIESIQDEINQLYLGKFLNLISLGSENFNGVKQIIEKKKGLFRNNMMGKRVNYSARTIVLPDPYISTSQVGFPQYFAMRLTFPERVTIHNQEKLAKFVINGPLVYPGANFISTKREGLTFMFDLSKFSDEKRKSFAMNLYSQNEQKIVYRHVIDGDIVLLNRQPTLHRPSIMAFKTKVLANQRTLRIHYANCKSFNADFDGDEINVHFPQDFNSQSEAYNLLNSAQNYIVPTSGKPIRGLIQDHIVASVIITLKDTFFTKEEYCDMLYNSIFHVENSDSFQILEPALYKPKRLWTGKQLITNVLKIIADGTIYYFIIKR
jgi:DNA-directed RNA polymerase I subunit RPA1